MDEIWDVEIIMPGGLAHTMQAKLSDKEVDELSAELLRMMYKYRIIGKFHITRPRFRSIDDIAVVIKKIKAGESW